MDNLPAAAGPKRQPNDLSQPLQYLKGIGPRRAALLARLGMHSVHDALYYLPYRYEDSQGSTRTQASTRLWRAWTGGLGRRRATSGSVR